MIPGIAVSATIAFLRRAWPYLAIAALTYGALSYAMHIGFQRGAESRQPEIAALTATIADVRAKTAEAKAADLANTIRVEADQTKVQANVETDLRYKLADARAAVERLRRAASPHTDRGGSPDLPRATVSAAISDGAGGDAVIPYADALTCADNAVKAQGWQDWYRQVQAIDRGND